MAEDDEGSMSHEQVLHEPDDELEQQPEPAPEPATEPDAEAPDRWRGLRWLFTRRLCFGGIVVATLFFFVSMTPSLVPRSVMMQGVVSGASAVLGYGLGSLVSASLRRFGVPEPSTGAKQISWRALPAGVVLVGGAGLWLGAWWQEDLRQLMEMDRLQARSWLTILLITIVVAGLLLVVARLIRGLTRGVISLLDRFLPHQVTVATSLAVVTIIVVGLAQGVLFNAMVSAVNGVYSVADDGTNSWISQPESPLRSGSAESLIEWDTLGTRGRDFAGDGAAPTVEEISAFTGRPAMEPIRVYVGLKSAGDLDDRIDLALAELERTGAFDRSVLVVNSTTGTGWVDENVVDSIEFIHGGDTAQVAMQYSYLPSWVSFLVDKSKASETGEQLITAVVDRVESMPEAERPTLLVFGESLGSFGVEAAFTSPENMRSNIDGALLVGPTFENELHEELTAERDDGSPAWRPVIDGGETFRFAVDPADLADPELHPGDWSEPRIVYLQNSSDPITYFEPDLLLSEPDWLRGERGPDVSDQMVWLPFVSYLQIGADMAFAMSVPDGHGHRYGTNVVPAWVEVLRPEGWSDAATAELVDVIQARADLRAERKAGG